MFSYRILIEKDGKGFHGYVPALRGCHSQGTTIAEAQKNLREAIYGYIKTLQAHQEPIPNDTSIEMIETIEVSMMPLYAASSRA